jgi:hypothetical protein
MPAAALTRFTHFLQEIEYTRNRMDDLHLHGHIVKRDVEAVYEALFLRAVTNFEAFLEELFLAILQEKHVYPGKRVQVLMKTKSSAAMMEILLQERAYMDWLPFDKTQNRAKLYLKDGRPFTDLTAQDRAMLKTISTIRNAIAHRSAHAIEKFKKDVIAGQALLQRERTPAGYLRVSIGSAKRFDAYISELSRVAGVLS